MCVKPCPRARSALPGGEPCGGCARTRPGAPTPQAVHDHPAEVAGLEPLRPASLHVVTCLRRRLRAITREQRSQRVGRAAARTSCTRTSARRDRAPHRGGERAVVARDRVVPRSSPSTRPRNDLREVPTSTGTSTRATSSGEAASSARLCSSGLPEADAGVGQIASSWTPAARAAASRSTRNVADLADDVVVVRVASASCAARPACASTTNPAPAAATTPSTPGRPARGDVVDDRGAGVERGGGDRGLGRVDAHRHPASAASARRRAAPGAAPRPRRPARRRAGSTRRRRRARRRPPPPASSPWATAAGHRGSGRRRRRSRA